MFGKKQKEIESLRIAVTRAGEDILYYKNSRTASEEARNKAYESRDQMSKELDMALETHGAYDKEVYDLTVGQAKLKSVNIALADENRDLVRQLELLRALLAQIQITVKLPVRKPNG